LIKLLNVSTNLRNNMIEIIIYSGIALIILGAILYGVFNLIKRHHKKQINRHIFEILRPKPKIKKYKNFPDWLLSRQEKSKQSKN
jgi:hypothetical protein